VVAEIAGRPGRSLLFVRTKHGAERLAKQLGRVASPRSPARRTHPGAAQPRPGRVPRRSVPVLVATDVAARGIHVDDVSLVPARRPAQDGKDYLHRSGRHRPGGESGLVVLLVTPDQERTTRRLLTDAGVRPEQRDVVPVMPWWRRSPAGAVRPRGRPPGGRRSARPGPPARPSRASQPRSMPGGQRHSRNRPHRGQAAGKGAGRAAAR